MNYNTAVLSNGLRIIHLPAVSGVVYCGYAIAGGTRHEAPGDEGLAHFCEHVTFKGTHRRTSMQILNCLESVGGDLNAFTNKEHTVYHAAVLKEHTRRAVSLLSDIVFDSTYPQNEIDKEVAVICDEIESYNDSPADLIFDEFENAVFSGHPLGHNILGTEERLRTYTTADASRFTGRHYRTDNAVFFAYGDIAFDKLVRMVEWGVAGVSEGSRLLPVAAAADGVAVTDDSPLPPEPVEAGSGRVIIQQRGTHQSHVMLGRRAFSSADDRRMPLFVLNNILGGNGMNARLNVALRERNGLVYTVESSMTTYTDTGLWAVYFGCDRHDVKRCLRLTRREMDRLMQSPLTETQLLKAKRQLKGQIGVALDHRESFAIDFGKHFLHYGSGRDIDRLLERIDAVTAGQIQDVAQEVFSPATLTTLIFE